MRLRLLALALALGPALTEMLRRNRLPRPVGGA